MKSGCGPLLTHIYDFRAGALRWRRQPAEFLIHTRARGRAPHTLVGGIGMTTQAAVFSSHRTVIQPNWRRKRRRREAEVRQTVFTPLCVCVTPTSQCAVDLPVSVFVFDME